MLIPLVVALALAQPGAQPKKSGWVALVHTEGEVPAGWREALQKAAEENKGQSWVEPPAVTINEAKLALGCASFNASCAGQIAGMTGATHALIVDVVATGGTGKLDVELVRANGKVERERVTAELPDLGPDGLAWAQEVVRGATKNKVPALLVVQTNLPAEVQVDGNKEGTVAPGAPLRVRVDPGEHKLSLIGSGPPVVVTINAKPGQILRETHALEAKASVTTTTTTGDSSNTGEDHRVVNIPATPAPAQGGPSAVVVGWSLAGLGGAVALLGGSVYAVSFYNFYLNRERCEGVPEGCVPKEIMFGLYRDGERVDFFERDGTVWMSSSAAALGVGALLIGTGAFVALSEQPAEGAE